MKLSGLVARLAAAGIPDARREARLLAAEALEVPPIQLLGDPELPASPRLDAFAARREAREPLSRIIGKREFWSLPFRISPATLDPRPDSETLVQALLEVQPAPERLLDLGTGSGCLLLAVLSERPGAWGLGVDASAEAAATAKTNAHDLGMGGRAAFVVGDWGTAIDGAFDGILVNPPYIEDETIPALEPEVTRYDPWAALAGGRDGLDPLRAFAPDLVRLLKPSGTAVIEIGQGQEKAASAILSGSGLKVVQERSDLGGVVRCLMAVRSGR